MSRIPSSDIPFSALGRRAAPPTISHLMTEALKNPKLLSLAAGFTDNSSLPRVAVREAVDALTSNGDAEALQYGMNQGYPRLRRALARQLSRWEPTLDLSAAEGRFLVSNGSQQALYLAMQVLCDPGDIVLVDRPSYFVFLEMLRGMGVRPISIPTDDSGRIEAEALATLLRELRADGDGERLRAVYVVSYFSNPSSRSLDREEKAALAAVLGDNGYCVPVVEDAAYRDLYFTQPPEAPSVLSMPEWMAFPRLYLSTLTKPFATGLKVGYGYCTHEGWLDRMLHTKGHQDFGSANFNQAIMERVLTTGGFEEQLGRIRPLYERKMLALHHTLLDGGLSDLGWSWSRPDGGLYLWLQAPRRLDTRFSGRFFQDCVAAGVLYVPGDLCHAEGEGHDFVRLSFGVLSEGKLTEAGQRFVRVARRHCA